MTLGFADIFDRVCLVFRDTATIEKVYRTKFCYEDSLTWDQPKTETGEETKSEKS